MKRRLRRLLALVCALALALGLSGPASAGPDLASPSALLFSAHRPQEHLLLVPAAGPVAQDQLSFFLC